jgi:hypothetical protein
VSIRKAAAGLAFALILIGGFETYYLRIYLHDRAALGRTFEELPWRKLPGFRQFLLDVRAATREGEAIALWIEPMSWMGGYEYGYVRAGYLLAGRDVIPLLAPDGRILSANSAAADVIACYRCATVPAGFLAVRSTPAGLVLRRGPR